MSRFGDLSQKIGHPMFGYMGGTPQKNPFKFFVYHKMCVYLHFLATISDFQKDLREPSNNKKHFKKMSTKLDFFHHATAPAPYINFKWAILVGPPNS
jgi:hypothetical protein